MTQEQLKEEALNYIDYNLHLDTRLDLVIDILDDMSNLFYENGDVKPSNTLTTIVLTLKELLEQER